MKYYTIGKFAELIGKSIPTLRLWHKQEKLKPHHVTEGGTRYYSEQQYYDYFNMYKNIEPKSRIIGYCRVSSNKYKDDLEKQIRYVSEYCIAKGYQFEIISDIGSGINYNNKGLNELIDLIVNDQIKAIVILKKDRLIRFGFEIIDNLCKKFNTIIEIIDNTPKVDEQELLQDINQIITDISFNLQGERANKVKKILKKLKD